MKANAGGNVTFMHEMEDCEAHVCDLRINEMLIQHGWLASF